MASTFVPDMTMDWRPAPVVSPNYPQQRTLPTWGAVGTPRNAVPAWDPNTPAAVARKVAGLGGLGALGVISYEPSPFVRNALWVAGTAGLAGGCYHGYKRNRGSVGWALVWGLLGGIFPIVVLPLAVAQGFGKPVKR